MNNQGIPNEYDTALLKLDNTAKEYIAEGNDSAEKKRRNKEMAKFLDNCRSKIMINPGCPTGMHWDPITATCI